MLQLVKPYERVCVELLDAVACQVHVLQLRGGVQEPCGIRYNPPVHTRVPGTVQYTHVSPATALQVIRWRSFAKPKRSLFSGTNKRLLQFSSLNVSLVLRFVGSLFIAFDVHVWAYMPRVGIHATCVLHGHWLL